jgi:hypothetical protein
VHFLRFPLSAQQAEDFKKTKEPVEFGSDHENYRHVTKLAPKVKETLAGDL